MNITDVILQRARQQPDSIAFVERDRPLRYAGLDRAIRLAAAGLAARGVGEGSRVAIDVAHLPRHLILTLAIARLRAVSVSIPDAATPAGALAMLRAVGVERIVGLERRPGLDALEFIAADATLTRGLGAEESTAYGPAADDLPWRIIWSTGTTGTPKPIAITHDRALALTFAQQAVMPYGPRDVLYLALGMGPMFGLIHGLRALAFGARVLGQVTGALETFELCERMGATHFVTSPAIAGKLVTVLTGRSPRLPRMQLYLSGASVPPALRESISSRLTPRIGVIYGTTETGMTALSDPQTFAAHPQSSGRVVPWMQVEAVDEQDRPLPPGTDGELRIRGIGMARGYLGDEQASARVFRDGWFCPGDVGHVTADGLVVVRGRSADVLSAGGNKVSPETIEQALERHPGVAEAAAFVASSADGRRWLAAAIVPRGGFDAQTLREHCREQLGANAPAVLVPLRSIPRSALGKILRGQLAQRFAVNAPAGAGPGEATLVDRGEDAAAGDAG